MPLNGSAGSESQAGCLTAFYDLSVAPLTFDFLQFLVLAEAARIRGGYRNLSVIVVPDSEETKDRSLKDRFGEADRSWRLSQIIVPACSLMPSCAGRIWVCTSREQAEHFALACGEAIFPAGYRTDAPVSCFQLAEVSAAFLCGEEIPSLVAPDEAVRHVRQWLQAQARGRRAVSITLRDAPYGAEKNSDQSAWAAFVRALDLERYVPVIVPDSYRALSSPREDFGKAAMFPAAALNLAVRMALYQECYLNLFTNGGPQTLCHLRRATRAAVLKPLMAHWHDSTIFGHRRGSGLEPGQQLHFLPSHQRWFWTGDSLDEIHAAFEAMCAFLEGDGSVVPGSIFAANAESRTLFLQRAEETGSWAAAKRVISSLIAESPDDPDLLFRMGRCETWLRAFGSADAYFADARRIGGDRAEYLSAIGDLRVLQGDATDAIVCYRRAMALQPSFAQAYISLGMLMESLGHLEQAESMLRTGLLSAPNNVAACLSLSRVLDSFGKVDEAQRLRLKVGVDAPHTAEVSL